MSNDFKKRAEETAARITELIATTNSPFVTVRHIQGWIENAINDAFNSGKVQVDRDHQQYAIDKHLQSRKKK